MSNRKIRVGVSGHDLKFWYPLQRELEATGRYEFREDVWSGHDQHDEEVTRDLIRWADVLVAEWAMQNAVFLSRNKRAGQRLLVRLHLQERGTSYPERIDYANVDAMIFVGAHIMDECVAKFHMPRRICYVVGNYVDVDAYSLPKFGGSQFNLGIIGTAPRRKRLDLALDTLEILVKRDARYMLRVKGQSPADIAWLWGRVVEREYYEALYERVNSGELRHRVVFDPQGRDVPQWLKMVGFVLSPSDFESFHMAVAEGAASSAIPVVWNWTGVNDIYPELSPVASAAEAADQIDFFNRSAAGPRFRGQLQDAMRARYDKRSVVSRWKELLDSCDFNVSSVSGVKRDVLVVWAIDVWETFHRREMLVALAGHLAESHDLLIVEPGSHYQTVADLGWAPADELERMANGEMIKVGDNIFRTRLFTGGIPAGIPRASYQGSSDTLSVLSGLIDEHYGSEARLLHWIYKPDQAARIGSRAKFVYEVYDEYTMDFGTGTIHEDVVKMELGALRAASHVFFTSSPLLERKSGAATSFSLVGNGVAIDVFSRYRIVNESYGGRPVAGYLGNLAAFFDWTLMEDVCRRMSEVDFVFHGQVELSEKDSRWSCYVGMCALPNVTFTGRVGRERGAAAINRYDVLLIPFVVNDAMHAVNPLKLWEYFATGLPVVSTPMDAVCEDSPLLRVAHGSSDWLNAIREALSEKDMGLRDRRIKRAEEQAWRYLTREHAGVVASL
ncbi:glycosyltransferase [Stenotrophomonas sp. MH1]|uniref:Glycosyltransferase n=1 Tax=Stenotrophomonas capsici TaxID=3110230 RepID=A0ABU5V1F8_9GAMM|nr:glycosyltransferase [Stenotrophomonas sp. MH1]MEA5667181.1 glycosyltransferase [Stenotrophomonas sp. MH1]